MKKLFCSLCVLTLLAGACTEKENVRPLDETPQYRELSIDMSPEAAALIADRDLGRSSLEREVFESQIRPWLMSRGSGFDFPANDDGTPIRFANRFDTVRFGTYNVYTLTPADGYDTIILYTHGGAYVFDMVKEHLVTLDRLATRLRAKIVIPQYPLAPAETFEKAHDLLLEVYADILSEGKPIVVGGDSAGGGFALAITEEVRDLGWKMPVKLFLYSPWLDVTTSNPRISDYADRDVSVAAYGAIECGKMWAGSADRRDPRISPLFGNLDGLPDMLLFVGDAEIMYPDNARFIRMVRGRTNVTFVVGHGLFHVFPVYYYLPEAQQSQDILVDFLRS